MRTFNRVEDSLEAKGSFIKLYQALSRYLNLTQEHERRMEIGPDGVGWDGGLFRRSIEGVVVAEMAFIYDNIEHASYFLNGIERAKRYYQKALGLLQHLIFLDTKKKDI